MIQINLIPEKMIKPNIKQNYTRFSTLIFNIVKI